MNEAASASWTYAAAEAASAVHEYDDARRWVRDKRVPVTTPLAVEVWIFNEALDRTLLVRHRWRGWVPPGGAVEPGEHPRVAAVRETFEETGVVLSQLGRPAAVAVRSFRADWSLTLALSYWAVCREVEAVGEAGQPVAWMTISDGWASSFSQDHDRRCWASLRKPLEDQGRVTMLSTCSRLGYRRNRGPKRKEPAAGTAVGA